MNDGVADALIALVGAVAGALFAGGLTLFRDWLGSKAAADAAALRCLVRLEKIQASPENDQEYEYLGPDMDRLVDAAGGLWRAKKRRTYLAAYRHMLPILLYHNPDELEGAMAKLRTIARQTEG